MQTTIARFWAAARPWPIARSRPAGLATVNVLTVIVAGSLFGPVTTVAAQTPSADQTPSAADQIAAAVQAAPVGDRAGAMVYGFRADGSLTTLREGTNSLICLADDPNSEGWSVACYHDSVEPYMARGRELRAEGVTDAGEVAQLRWAEAEAGTLQMPETPATLYVLTGDGFDVESGTVGNAYLRWVIYTPWATAETTGLSPQPPGPGAPWLMFPGTAGAHIMIMPAPPGGGS
jgi:hypothetical protein